MGMDLKGFLVSMMLIIGGGVVLSQSFPKGYEYFELFGWVPLVFGIILIALTLRQELKH